MTDTCTGETCYPMFIYLLLAVPGLIGSFFTPQTKGSTPQQKLAGSIAGALWVALWSFLMWELCKHCHRGWAWIMLLAPVILGIGIVITVIVIAVAMKNSKKKK